MFLTIKDNRKLFTNSTRRSLILARALTKLKGYKYNTSDLILSDFLKKETGYNLSEWILQLLSRAKIQADMHKEFIVIFNLGKDDQIARLITYGNLQVRGSNILKSLFI